jgi:hypothetical protein
VPWSVDVLAGRRGPLSEDPVTPVAAGPSRLPPAIPVARKPSVSPAGSAPVALTVGLPGSECSIRKGGLWGPGTGTGLNS